MLSVYLNLKSVNKKTGPIPVSTTSDETCPPSCPLIGKGCYAKLGPLSRLWSALSRATAGERAPFARATIQTLTWKQFTKAIAALPSGTLWRHNQAGDLPGKGDKIDTKALAALVAANAGKRGFTYTHKPLTKSNARAIAQANAAGFTINLSADNLSEADTYCAAGIGPVVVILPADVHGNAPLFTPQGRRISTCPATYRDDVSCATCQLCQRQERKTIVGFPAHGAAKRAASIIATS